MIKLTRESRVNAEKPDTLSSPVSVQVPIPTTHADGARRRGSERALHGVLASAVTFPSR